MFELQRNIGKQLEELPFQITRYGKVIATVNKYNVTLNTSATKLIEKLPNKPELCEHGFAFGLCKYNCKE